MHISPRLLIPVLHRVTSQCLFSPQVSRIDGGVLEVLSLRAAAGDDSAAASSSAAAGTGTGSDDEDEDASGAPPPASRAGVAGASSSRATADAVAAAARGTGMVVRRVTLPGARLHCNACDSHFETPDQHRVHFRSDIHRCVCVCVCNYCTFMGLPPMSLLVSLLIRVICWLAFCIYPELLSA